MEQQGKYVYCVVKGTEKRTFGRGFGGNIVYTIPYKDISAVVSETPPVEYEPNETNALVHEEVVERVMQERTVIPLGFGNIFINESRVRWLLARFYWTFKTYLQKLEGKTEVGVKVFYDLEVAKREIEATCEFERSKEDSALKVAEHNYHHKVNEKAYDYGVRVYQVLKKRAEDAHLMKRIGGNMILNGAFLVRKTEIQDFETELEKLKKEYADKGLEFQFSGPWPPYNFARIHISG